jgi:predicted double-glycine peptidase
MAKRCSHPLARPRVGCAMRGVVTGALIALMMGATVVAAQPVRAPAQSPVAQINRFDCGAAALATVLTLRRGRDVTPRALISGLVLSAAQQAAVQDRGYSLYELALMARAAGAHAVVRRLDAQSLHQLSLPALVYLSLPTGPHFSVVTEVVGDRVALADPSQGFMVWPRPQFLAAWAPSGEGYTLAITVDPDASV